MASIRKRPNGKWEVQVRRAGRPTTCKLFHDKKDAIVWARDMEVQADRGELPVNRDQLRSVTVGQVLERYRETVLPNKEATTQLSEGGMIKVLLRQSFCSLSLANLTSEPFAAYRDHRLKSVKPATVCRELGILQHAFDLARKEWGIPLAQNPLADLRKPALRNGRKRRISAEELERLEKSCREARVVWLWLVVELALETAMRRSELLNIRHGDINYERRTLFIPKTKNGHPRTIPLTKHAIWILKVGDPAPDGRLYPITPNALRLAWQRARKRAGITDLRFHDLRHEAISRFFERGLSVPEVALISGHRDYRMLARYTHLKADDIVNKL